MKNCIGIDIGGTFIKYSIIREDGQLLMSSKERTTIEGADALIKQLKIIISKLLTTVYRIDGIGISSAGQIDSTKGEVIFATDTLKGWTGVKIKEIIESTFVLPCFVENDVNAAALGELHYGNIDSDSFLCLTVGTGIGGAIIESGKLYTGTSFSAGEFGHMITHHKGLQCNCGNRGCYEKYAAVSALIKRAKESLSDEVFTEDKGAELLFENYEENEEIKNLINEYLDEVSIGIISLIHIFNPRVVLIGGAISKNNIFIQGVRKRIKDNCMKSFVKNLEILPASLENNASMLGAVSGIFKR